MGILRVFPRRPPGWSGVRWTSRAGIGLIAAFMLPILVLAIVSIISVRQRQATRRLLVAEIHSSVADLLTARLDEALDGRERELLAELDAGNWEGRGLLESLNGMEKAFPELRPIVMVSPTGQVVYPVRARLDGQLPGWPPAVVQTSQSVDDSYAWLLDRGREAEIMSNNLAGAQRMYRRAAGTAETDHARVRALHAMARTQLKAGEVEEAAATWERVLAFADPLDSELTRWGLIAQIGLSAVAEARGNLKDACRIRIEMLDFITHNRFNLDADVYEFYRKETEVAITRYQLDKEQRETIAELVAEQSELDRIERALDLLVRQAPQLGGMEGAVVTAAMDIEGADGAVSRQAPDWTIAYLTLPGDTSGSTVISARGNSGWRVLRRWRADSVTRLLERLLFEEGPWRGFGIALLDPNSSVAFASSPTVPTDRVVSRLDLVALPGWRIAAFPRGGSIDDAARQDVLDYSVLLGAAFLAVVGGLILATRTLSREVALARTRSDFVSNVSHELKTPLALIRMFAENLRAGWVPETKRAEYYEVMLSESERLSGVIDNVLDFSRMESGRREFHLRPTDTTALISGILERYRYSLETAGITLTALLPDRPIVASVDRDGLAQVLVNLLSNATKYIGDGAKEVMVSLAEDGPDMVIVVRDTGVGMSDDSIQEIFAPFTRIDDPEVHSVAGSGIGLTIVRHIVDAHGGRIDVESRQQHGSSFRVRIPRGARARDASERTAETTDPTE